MWSRAGRAAPSNQRRNPARGMERRGSGPLDGTGGEEGPGGHDEHLQGGVDAQHRGVEDQVVETGFGRIDVEEPFHEKAAGPVGLVLAPPGGLDAEILVGGRPGDAPLDGPVEADVIGPGPRCEHHRPGATEQHGGGAGGQLPDAVLGALANGIVVLHDGIGRYHHSYAGGPGEVAQKPPGRRGLLLGFVEAFLRPLPAGGVLRRGRR